MVCLKSSKSRPCSRVRLFLSNDSGELQPGKRSVRRGLGALTDHLDELQRQLTETVSERDEKRHDLDNSLSQLADLKRSRLLKVGRLLRRIAGLPMPY